MSEGVIGLQHRKPSCIVESADVVAAQGLCLSCVPPHDHPSAILAGTSGELPNLAPISHKFLTFSIACGLQSLVYGKDNLSHFWEAIKKGGKKPTSLRACYTRNCKKGQKTLLFVSPFLRVLKDNSLLSMYLAGAPLNEARKPPRFDTFGGGESLA